MSESSHTDPKSTKPSAPASVSSRQSKSRSRAPTTPDSAAPEDRGTTTTAASADSAPPSSSKRASAQRSRSKSRSSKSPDSEAESSNGERKRQSRTSKAKNAEAKPSEDDTPTAQTTTPSAPSTASASPMSKTSRSESKTRRKKPKDTAATPTRDTVLGGDLTTIMQHASAAKSLFDLRRAFFRGNEDTKETIPHTTLRDLDTAIRTRLGALTGAQGQTLASCATGGLGAIKRAFHVGDILHAIAGPLGPTAETQFASTVAGTYTDMKSAKAASMWVTQLGDLARARGIAWAGGVGAGEETVDIGVTSGVPSAFETKAPNPNEAMAIKDPRKFDQLILKFVRGEIQELLKAKGDAQTSRGKTKSDIQSSGKNEQSSPSTKRKDRERSPRAQSASNTTKDAVGRDASTAQGEVMTTTPAESVKST